MFEGWGADRVVCLDFCFGRYKVLNKDPPAKETNDSDKFTFNKKFTDRQRKIKMSLLVTKVHLTATLRSHFGSSIPYLAQARSLHYS